MIWILIIIQEAWLLGFSWKGRIMTNGLEAYKHLSAHDANGDSWKEPLNNQKKGLPTLKIGG